MLAEKEAFAEQKGRPKFEQNFTVLTFLNYIEHNGVDWEYEITFAVPTEWVCKYLSFTEEEYYEWYETESNSDETRDIFWEAVNNDLVAMYSDSLTGSLA